MNFKPSQMESFCRAPNPDVKCVILFGNNKGAISLLQKQCAQAVCGDVKDAFRYAVLEAENLSKDFGEIYAEFHAQSLIGGRRVVLVKNVENSIAAFLKNMLSETKSQNLLILSSTTLNTRSSLITWAKDRTDVIIVGCYEERDADIVADTEKMLREKGLMIDMPTMQLLCARLSPDKKINQGEINKLEMYLGGRKNVTKEDVKAAVSDVAGANVEDLCYFTAGGNIARATSHFVRLINEGEDASTLVRQISYHFMKLLDCSAQLEKGVTMENVLKTLRPPLMFYRKDEFVRQLKIWHKEHLLDALSKLYDCERECKTTGMPAEELVSFLRLAGAAQKLQKRG